MIKKVGWKPHKGELVKVCYDGKIGRAEMGEVLQVRGCFIKVRFRQWASDDGSTMLTAYFPRLPSGYFGAQVAEKQHGIMKMLGCQGDWYSVFPYEIGRN